MQNMLETSQMEFLFNNTAERPVNIPYNINLLLVPEAFWKKHKNTSIKSM